MPLEIHPVSESDFPEFVRILLAAFASGSGLSDLITPSPLPSDYVQNTIDKHTKWWREESDVHYLKVIDTDLNGAMVACAKWRINENERTEEQLKAMLPVPGPDEEGRPIMQDFMRFLSHVRKEFLGTKPSCRTYALEQRQDKC